MTLEEYNKFVKKRRQKLLFKKIFLFVTCPVWVLPFIFYLIIKDTWEKISDWVEKRNPGPK